MRDKAIIKEAESLQKVIKQMCHPKNKEEEYQIIQRYNSLVIGIHNYYQIATHISYDCSKLAYRVNRTMKTGFGKRLKKTGELTQGYFKDRYGGSKQIRYIHKFAIAPVGFIQTKYPVYKKREINQYTPKGRLAIHKNLGVNMAILLALMRQKEIGRSVEFADNRISLYAAQQGRCAITNNELALGEIYCHHKLPVHLGGADNYANLVITHVKVHRLIHATDQKKIVDYLAELNLNSAMLNKVNKLREMALLQPIS